MRTLIQSQRGAGEGCSQKMTTPEFHKDVADLRQEAEGN